MFEVEKKFKVPADFTNILLNQGWKYLKEARLKDTYFDTENYQLTSNGFWLRKRGTKWQLKCPASQEEKQKDSVRIDKYQEIEEEQAIFDRLALVLNAQSSSIVDRTVKKAAEMWGLKPLAEFESFRTTYAFDRFKIDLDKTSFGYELGELEVLCETESEMEEATSKIFDMASKFGLNIHNNVTGKVGICLKMTNEPLYNKLISKKILVPETI